MVNKASIYNVANSVSVEILCAEGRGSGVIIKKEKNAYTVLTNEHVLKEYKSNSIVYLVTCDKKVHIVDNQTIFKSKKVDVGLVKFYSTEKYQIAKIDKEDEVKIGDDIFIAGFRSGQLLEDNTLRFVSGNIISVSKKFVTDGWELYFDGPTVRGMSGGPLFNEQSNLIAINAGSETEETENGIIETGYNAGVPIKYYFSFVQELNDLGINLKSFIPKKIECNLNIQQLFEELPSLTDEDEDTLLPKEILDIIDFDSIDKIDFDKTKREFKEVSDAVTDVLVNTPSRTARVLGEGTKETISDLTKTSQYIQNQIQKLKTSARKKNQYLFY